MTTSLQDHFKITDASEGGTNVWTLDEDFKYYSDVLGSWVVVRKGLTFDGESVPRFLRSLVPDFGGTRKAGLAHDSLYQLAGYYTPENEFVRVDQKTADAVYKELGYACDKIPKWRVWNRWLWLRIAGRKAWNEHRERERRQAESNFAK